MAFAIWFLLGAEVRLLVAVGQEKSWYDGRETGCIWKKYFIPRVMARFCPTCLTCSVWVIANGTL